MLSAARRAGSLPVDRVMSRDMTSWIEAAKAHCAYVVLLNFVDAVNESRSRVGRATALVMDRLVALHALATMDDRMGDFLEDGHVSGEQAAAIRAEISKLLAELRPDAAALVGSATGATFGSMDLGSLSGRGGSGAGDLLAQTPRKFVRPPPPTPPVDRSVRRAFVMRLGQCAKAAGRR